MALIWLLRKLRPDFKTIAEFRKHNPQALQALFREGVLLCKPLALFGAELLAIDGSKFKAVNSKHKNLTKAKLAKALKDIDEKMAQSLRDLDTADGEESSAHQPTSAELQEKIKRRHERRKRYRGFVQEITASGESQLSLTDPDSRSMPKSPTVEVGYNVQRAVDSQHKRIVEQDVTTAITDDDQLSPLAISAKETLGVERMRAAADMGDAHGDEINACDEAGLDAYGPKPSTSANTTLGLFGTERFTYAPEKDCARCPRGEELTFRLATTALGRLIRDYAPSAGRSCPIQEQCTRNTGGRRMTRWVAEQMLERMEERLNANPEIMQERKQLVEHPFGPIKHANDRLFPHAGAQERSR